MLSIDVRPREAEGQQTGVIIGVSLPLVVIIGLLSLALTLFAVVTRKRKKKKRVDRKSNAAKRSNIFITKSAADNNQSISLTENESYGVFKATNTSSDAITKVLMTENESYEHFPKSEEPEYF